MTGDTATLADAMVTGRELDLDGATVRAADLAEALTAPLVGGAPSLRLRRATVSGLLQLTGARVPVPVELRDCRFSRAPDLRMAEFAGLVLTGSHLPGLAANNLRVRTDLMLDGGFRAMGPVDLTDAQIDGSLRLSNSRLLPDRGRALIADRIVVGGTCYARRLRSSGEVRLPGARVTGNLDLAGAELSSATGNALDATGVVVGGSLLAGRYHRGQDEAFRASGRVLLAGARIGGDLVLSGARITRPPGDEPDPVPLHPAEETRVPVVPRGIIDAAACLVADRVGVEGNLELDDGFTSSGTLRLPNAVVRGYMRLSGAQLVGPYGASERGIALLGDGMDVGGDLEARDDGRGALSCAGQLRLVNAHVRGSAILSGVRLSAPDGYALLGDRLRIGGEFYLRRAVCSGTIRLENAEIGATMDCEGATLDRPRLRTDGTVRPSLDARAATVGKDLLCTDGFSASGGVRVRRMDVHKSVQFAGATLGSSSDSRVPYALNAYGLTTAELVVTPAAPPGGAVRLEQARVGRFTDSATLWDATGGVVIDGFDYDLLNDTLAIDVRTRLDWIEQVMPDYAPGPYEQLAAAYRRAGNEELAERVLMTRQRRRYAEAGMVGRIWGTLQRLTVGYGYQPWLAVWWLVLFWLLGGGWFTFNVPAKLDNDQNPVFNPWLFAADTLLPIVNLGQDGYWQMVGPSQWISSSLVAAGWILATTAAAGAARVLKRV